MTEPTTDRLATLYRFCAQSLRYPDPEWFTNDYVDTLYLLLDALDASRDHETIQLRFSQAGDPLEELQIEYTRLFINGVPHVIAPPYGSVYLDRSLQGPHTEKTRLFYRDHGLDLQDESELADHIVHQLEFLALLAEKKDTSAATNFLREIFLPWFPKFATRVRKETTHPFYSVIVQLIEFLTKEDDDHGIQLDEA